MTVGESINTQASRKRRLVLALFAAWILLVVVDERFGVAKSDWIGLPVFLAFVFGFVYLLFLNPVRCPRCDSALHKAFYPRLNAPAWAPAWLRRWFPRAQHCEYCGVPFSLTLDEATSWNLHRNQ